MQIAIATQIGYQNNAGGAAGVFDDLLNDTFTTDLAAGAVVGTPAEPGPGVRQVVADSGNYLALSGGNCVISGRVANADPGLWYGAVARNLGQVLVATGVTYSGGWIDVGFDSDQVGGIGQAVSVGSSLTIRMGGFSRVVGAATSGVAYTVAVLLRAAGCATLIKGGAFTNWTLLWLATIGDQLTAYPAIVAISTGAAGSVGSLRAPVARWFLSPILSDTFSELAESDGLGHAEGITAWLAGEAAAGLYCIGDSKTEGEAWPTRLVGNLGLITTTSEITPQPAIGGYDALEMAAVIDAYLADADGQATVVTINLGANDVALLASTINETNWKAAYTYIIDAVLTKWPRARIFCARAWRRGYDDECDTLAGWIDDVVATYVSNNVFLGMDERIWLENGDDGATYTIGVGGVHYTEAAQAVCAAEWQTAFLDAFALDGSLGAGGGGVAWTAVAGTWAVTGGVAAASALASGRAIRTADCGKADVIITAKCTLAGGTMSIIVRWTDENNFIQLRLTSTNRQLVKVVAGVTTTVSDTAYTYAAGAELRLVCQGSAFRTYYNDLAVGNEFTISDAALQSSTVVGLRTDNTGNTFDDLVVYARGSGGEYNAVLDAI